MATKKKTPATKTKTSQTAKSPAKKKTAPAEVQKYPVQNVIALIKSFQTNTLVAIFLALAFLFFQLFPELLRNIWWLNILTATGAGYLFWRQEGEVTGLEKTVCRYSLFAVVALFLWRDINISNDLMTYINR